MQNLNSYREYLAGLCEQLDSLQIEQIDFDEMSERLEELGGVLGEFERCRQDLDILRNDYADRIAGMLKATAAANRRWKGPEPASGAQENLLTLGGQELVERYRMISAKFRDAFPTSFAFCPGGAAPTAGIKDISDYK